MADKIRVNHYTTRARVRVLSQCTRVSVYQRDPSRLFQEYVGLMIPFSAPQFRKAYSQLVHQLSRGRLTNQLVVQSQPA